MSFEPTTLGTIRCTCPKGLAPVLKQEIIDLGYHPTREDESGVELKAAYESIYELNLKLRTAHHVLWEIASQSPLETLDEVYTLVSSLPWEDWVSPDGYVSFTSSVFQQGIKDFRIVGLKAKDALADRMTSLFGKRPDSGSDDDKTVIFIHWKKNAFSIFIDTSGQSLHRRGYRLQPHKAPVQETLAAGLILSSSWKTHHHFVNPMCGSGTLAIEAALMALNKAPGSYRDNFGFMHLLCFDESKWNQVKEEAQAQEKPVFDGLIVATDRDTEAVEAAKANARRAGLAAHIMFRVSDYRSTLIPTGKGVIVLNPEYGKRLGDERRLEKVYSAIGDFFKQKGKGYTGYILSSNMSLLRKVGLKPTRKWMFKNGPLDTQFAEYTIF